MSLSTEQFFISLFSLGSMLNFQPIYVLSWMRTGSRFSLGLLMGGLFNGTSACSLLVGIIVEGMESGALAHYFLLYLLKLFTPKGRSVDKNITYRAMEDTSRKSWTHCVVDQYVKEVTDFSSQYGSDGSISYVANNIIGKPTLYPDYGDFSAAYCLVT